VLQTRRSFLGRIIFQFPGEPNLLFNLLSIVLRCFGTAQRNPFPMLKGSNFLAAEVGVCCQSIAARTLKLGSEKFEHDERQLEKCVILKENIFLKL